MSSGRSAGFTLRAMKGQGCQNRGAPTTPRASAPSRFTPRARQVPPAKATRRGAAQTLMSIQPALRPPRFEPPTIQTGTGRLQREREERFGIGYWIAPVVVPVMFPDPSVLADNSRYSLILNGRPGRTRQAGKRRETPRFS